MSTFLTEATVCSLSGRRSTAQIAEVGMPAKAIAELAT